MSRSIRRLGAVLCTLSSLLLFSHLSYAASPVNDPNYSGVTLAANNPCAANPCAANPCAANPCAATNPCAANPCAMKKKLMNPCAANPCAANPCAASNPCAMKKKPMNPCAVNPCAANPCAAGNPCAMKKKPMNPCAANPCAANPCAASNPCAAGNPCATGNKVDAKLVTRPSGPQQWWGDRDALVSYGKKLWNDPALSSNGLTCGTCHSDNRAFQPSFAQPYPHQVKMAKERAAMDSIELDEMVQLCMVVPMASQPLGWDSKELAALTAYTEEVQKSFQMAASNPCAAKNPCATNPCAAKNPCAMNPCAAKNPCATNPCAAKNPCATNPCAAQNPCATKKWKNPCAANPCAAKNPCAH